MCFCVYILNLGSDHGLQLTMNIQQYEYMAGPHDSAGLKMLMFEHYAIPLVNELGQAISTGSHTYVGIKIMQVSATRANEKISKYGAFNIPN